jgi:ornithine decarboxylase
MSSLTLKSVKISKKQQIGDIVRQLHPSAPLHILHTEKLAKRAKEFITQFKGTVMYAVKCNPSKEVIKTLAKSGIAAFDAASIEEIRLVRKYAPAAQIHFMHTVKSREAIREAYFDHGVRIFVIDCADELHKIIHETDLAPDLDIFVRLALPKNENASVDFSVKFGAHPEDAITLLREARLVSARLGVMFHPGSQSRDPSVFRRGIDIVANIVRQSGVKVDSIDVGGGFPVTYPDQTIPPLTEYMDTIHQAIADNHLQDLDLYCEPGRALVAESGSLIMRVELRKGNTLYLNDGVYGGLVEAAKYQGGFIYPTRIIRKDAHHGDDTTLMPFRFCGPTCDSVDMMDGPFILPADIKEGDWIDIGCTGAYSVACRTNFNGFGKHHTIIL